MTRAGAGGGGLAWYHVAGGILLALALLTTAWLGIGDVLEEYDVAVTAGQKAATATEALYGMLAAAAIVGLAARRAWTRVALHGWVIAMALTAALAAVFWGGSGPLTGALSAAVALGLGWTLLWLGSRAVAVRVSADESAADR